MFAVAFLLSSNAPSAANAAEGPFRCADTSLYFPVSGLVGWTYRDPAATDTDASGNSTVHTGVDVFADQGDGSPVFAPADGVVSRHPNSEGANLVLPGAINILTGEYGLELYITHIRHALAFDQSFRAGDLIGYQLGDHIHLSVGAFIGYDDRQLGETQDPSPYFNAALSFNPYVHERQTTAYWCHQPTPIAAAATAGPPPPVPTPPRLHIVQSGDTLGAIAELHGSTVEALAAANGLTDVDALSVGQELFIPGHAAAGVLQNPATPGPETATGPVRAQPGLRTYVVQAGDSLYAIAERFATDIEKIVALNNLADPDVLSVGQELLIP
jgi:LysM repeat protein